MVNKSPVSKCWDCGSVFEDDGAEFCGECQTFICPSCGTHYCTLPEPVRRALDAEMWSVGLWNPYTNPPRRKKRRSESKPTREILPW